jgi:bacterioferritin-associated ferredoxin
MRTALSLALGLLFVTAGAGFAEDKPINTKCPKSGKACEAGIVAKVKDGDKTVSVGACCGKCKAAIEKDPAKYVAAAKEDKTAGK